MHMLTIKIQIAHIIFFPQGIAEKILPKDQIQLEVIDVAAFWASIACTRVKLRFVANALLKLLIEFVDRKT